MANARRHPLRAQRGDLSWLRFGSSQGLGGQGAGRRSAGAEDFCGLESDADAATLLPHQGAALLGTAVKQGEALGERGAVVDFQAGSSGRKINDAAIDRRRLRIEDDLT